jgi:4'-phosphopantetheinyl transferase
MIYIYTAHSDIVRQKKELRDLLNFLPESMHERALRYKFEEDAYNFVVGRLLLKKALEETGMADELENIAYKESGKPRLENKFFNISHSGNLVVLALSQDGEVGIDVEEVKQVQLEDMRPWFTENEWKAINQAPDPLQTFFSYWTRKESIIKAMGINLSHLHKIEVDITKDYFIDQGKKWYVKGLDLGEGYIGALCCEGEIRGVSYGQVNSFQYL